MEGPAWALAVLAYAKEVHEDVVAYQVAEGYRWPDSAYMHTHWRVGDEAFAVVQDWSSAFLDRWCF